MLSALTITAFPTLTIPGRLTPLTFTGLPSWSGANRLHPPFTRMVCTLKLMGMDFRTTTRHGQGLVLETMRPIAVAQVSQMAHLLLLTNRRYCAAQTVRMPDVSENTVWQWIAGHQRDGVDSLDDRPRIDALSATMRHVGCLYSFSRIILTG